VRKGFGRQGNKGDVTMAAAACQTDWDALPDELWASIIVRAANAKATFATCQRFARITAAYAVQGVRLVSPVLLDLAESLDARFDCCHYVLLDPINAPIPVTWDGMPIMAMFPRIKGLFIRCRPVDRLIRFARLKVKTLALVGAHEQLLPGLRAACTVGRGQDVILGFRTNEEVRLTNVLLGTPLLRSLKIRVHGGGHICLPAYPVASSVTAYADAVTFEEADDVSSGSRVRQHTLRIGRASSSPIAPGSRLVHPSVMAYLRRHGKGLSVLELLEAGQVEGSLGSVLEHVPGLKKLTCTVSGLDPADLSLLPASCGYHLRSRLPGLDNLGEDDGLVQLLGHDDLEFLVECHVADFVEPAGGHLVYDVLPDGWFELLSSTS
jgi:hypothetical protein